MNESQSYIDFGHDLSARNKEAAALPSWLIIDQRHRQRYMASSLLTGGKAKRAMGIVVTAPTLEGLAAKMEIDPAALRRHCGTVQRLRPGRRRRRLRPRPHRLRQLLRGPAREAQPQPRRAREGAVHGRADCSRRPRHQGRPAHRRARPRAHRGGHAIAGLYAAGNTTASVMGHTYPGPGSTISPAAVFGYLGARHAAGTSHLRPAPLNLSKRRMFFHEPQPQHPQRRVNHHHLAGGSGRRPRAPGTPGPGRPNVGGSASRVQNGAEPPGGGQPGCVYAGHGGSPGTAGCRRRHSRRNHSAGSRGSRAGGRAGRRRAWVEKVTTGRFAGKTIIVTGAGSGIGRATASRVAREGGRVIAVESRRSASTSSSPRARGRHRLARPGTSPTTPASRHRRGRGRHDRRPRQHRRDHGRHDPVG